MNTKRKKSPAAQRADHSGCHLDPGRRVSSGTWGPRGPLLAGVSVAVRHSNGCAAVPGGGTTRFAGYLSARIVRQRPPPARNRFMADRQRRRVAGCSHIGSSANRRAGGTTCLAPDTHRITSGFDRAAEAIGNGGRPTCPRTRQFFVSATAGVGSHGGGAGGFGFTGCGRVGRGARPPAERRQRVPGNIGGAAGGACAASGGHRRRPANFGSLGTCGRRAGGGTLGSSPSLSGTGRDQVPRHSGRRRGRQAAQSRGRRGMEAARRGGGRLLARGGGAPGAGRVEQAQWSFEWITTNYRRTAAADEAVQRLAALAQDAEGQRKQTAADTLRQAISLHESGDLAEAQRLLEWIVATYSDTATANEASKRLNELLQGERQQRGQAAERMLRQAVALQEGGKLIEARRLLFQIVSTHRQSPQYEDAVRRQRQVEQALSEQEAGKELRHAAQMREEGRTDQARWLLEQIVRKYRHTPLAKEAATHLEQLARQQP